jgi:hypothetical protein
VKARVLPFAICATGSLVLAGGTIPVAADETSSAADLDIAALSLRLPNEEKVSFAALPNDATVAGDPGSMLYAGPLPVALIEVAAHGAFESHKQANEKKTKNSLNDIVLAPYQGSLSHFTNAELMRRALDGLPTHGTKVLVQYSEKAGVGWLIECSPRFFMTPDARALVLQNDIVIHSPDAASPATFKNVVEVVGPPRDSVGKDSENTWMVQDGAVLTGASVDLLRESLSLALSELRGDFAGPARAFHTVRYPRGGEEKMERAQTLRQTPQRVVLKTLRGWIMSVPAAA